MSESDRRDPMGKGVDKGGRAQIEGRAQMGERSDGGRGQTEGRGQMGGEVR